MRILSLRMQKDFLPGMKNKGFMDLSAPEEFRETPSKIIGTKERGRRESVLPMCYLQWGRSRQVAGIRKEGGRKSIRIWRETAFSTIQYKHFFAIY